MHKRVFLASASIVAALLIGGCENAQRDVESMVKRDAGIGGGDIGTPADNNGTVAMQPPVGGVTDENSTIGEIKVDAKNAYRVAVTFSENYTQRGYFSRDEVSTLHFDITNLYTGAAADTTKIEEIRLEAEETNSATDGKYLNFITFDGEEGPTYTIPGDSVKASDDVAFKVKELSGTTNIVLKVTIAGMPTPYTLKVPIVIEKNRSSSMAIVPYETTYQNGLFIDKFVIHVVDSYGNRAKDGTHISTGVINNPKLYFRGFNDNQTKYGILDKNSSEFQLPANSLNPDIIDTSDTLITIATEQEHHPENLGGWDIEDLIPQESKLKIINLDKGDNIYHLGFVIGNEYRYDSCHDTVMNAAAATFESTEVKDGLAYATLRYVPSMVGKTVFIYANTRLDNKRIGISRLLALTGTGLKPVTVNCTNDEGKHSSCRKTLSFVQNDSEKFAREAYIAHPLNTGDAENARISFPFGYKTDCNGNIYVEIYNIDVNKTATYTLGVIATESIKNK